jgi:hypothetical protein
MNNEKDNKHIHYIYMKKTSTNNGKMEQEISKTCAKCAERIEKAN